ncbi:hypothetical protein [Daejeonella oryzae]|uniref:hypothetical protein n=1 Tax=Daejeonella oryzae TaxID=1122943 RepID=UPI000478884A|nr:hypothetical protein [Daejeonella oryzae]
MTYQLDISHYRSSNNDARLWMFAKIFLSLLFLNTLGVAFYFNFPALSLLNVILGLVFLAVMIKLISKRIKVPFVQIAGGTLKYFNPREGEMISVSAKDITHISTRFCELKVHTEESVHSLNLGLIRNEKTRWEIKEMIREMARTDGGLPLEN